MELSSFPLGGEASFQEKHMSLLKAEKKILTVILDSFGKASL